MNENTNVCHVRQRMASIEKSKDTERRLYMPGVHADTNYITSAVKSKEQVIQAKTRTRYKLILGLSLLALILGMGFVEGRSYIIGVPICFTALAVLSWVAVKSNRMERD